MFPSNAIHSNQSPDLKDQLKKDNFFMKDFDNGNAQVIIDQIKQQKQQSPKTNQRYTPILQISPDHVESPKPINDSDIEIEVSKSDREEEQPPLPPSQSQNH